MEALQQIPSPELGDIFRNAMSHETLNDQQVGTLFKVMRGKRMTKSIGSIMLGYFGRFITRLIENLPYCSLTDMFSPFPTFKKPVYWFIFAVISAQDGKQVNGELCIALLTAFPLLNFHLHTFTVNICDPHAHALRYTHTC